MAFIEVNGAQIYYQQYDSPHTDRRPIVLIHGSTQTGAHDWAFLAPLLARDYPVIVPDCRGHGQSSNPLGPTTGTFRVVRGGSWGNDGDVGSYLRAAYRDGNFPSDQRSYFGFRCGAPSGK